MTAEEQKQIAIAKSLQTEQGEVEKINKIALSIDLAIFGFSENTLKVLLIRFPGAAQISNTGASVQEWTMFSWNRCILLVK